MDLIKYFVKCDKGWYHIPSGEVERQIKDDIHQYSIDLVNTDDNGNNILHILCETGCVDIIALLLAKKYPWSDYIDVKNNKGKTPLHIACNSYKGVEIVKLLIDFGADVNLCDNYNNTALHYACENRNEDILEILIDFNAQSLNVVNNNGRTPLYHACVNENISCVNVLVNCPNIDLNRCDDNGKTPLMVCVNLGNHDYVELLLGLHEKIIYTEHDFLVADLVPKYYPNIDDNPININQTDNDGNTALHWACYDNCEYNTIWILFGHPKIDVNRVNDDGDTPLVVACMVGNLYIIPPLLMHDNIDVNSVTNNYDTLIHLCCRINGPIRYSCGEKKILEDIIFHPKLDVNAMNYDGDTALHIACHDNNYDVTKILLSHPNLDINKPDSVKTIHDNCNHDEDCTSTTFCLYLSSVVKDRHNTTPLMVACKNGHNDIVELLLSHPKINIHSVDSNGYGAITYAQKFCSPSVVGKLLSMH